MENFGTIFPSLIVGENQIKGYYITTTIQCIAFFIITCFIIRIVKLYFKNIELKKESEKNQKEIEENFEKIGLTLKLLIKVGFIVFTLVILSQLILSYFMNV